ncbi:unnamed protein product [Moneuplotes crassus]|uniref:RBR-type E3 ubiquitin transferase n=1 Tax=Euplotes crassus TaxID=5936 RepID=A0AAD1UNA0_EUPCR|nr:unnamed protein product [Moneuplotes crassus]
MLYSNVLHSKFSSPYDKLIGSMQEECRDYDTTLMFIMGTLYSKFRKQTKLEKILEITTIIQSKLTHCTKAETSRILRHLSCQVRVQDIFRLSYLREESRILHSKEPSTKRVEKSIHKKTLGLSKDLSKPTFSSRLKSRKPTKSNMKKRIEKSPAVSPQKTLNAKIHHEKAILETSDNRKTESKMAETKGKEKIKRVQEAIRLVRSFYNEANSAAECTKESSMEEEKEPVLMKAQSPALMKSSKEEEKVGVTETPTFNNDSNRNFSDCPICYDSIEIKDLVLTECGHMYHAECFEMYIRSKVEVKAFPINCPSLGCMKKLPESDIREVCDEKLYQKYERFEFEHFVEQNPDLYHFCPTPDCQYVFECDITTGPYKHDCKMCSETYCLKCKEKWHQGLTCEELKEIKESSPEDYDVIKVIRGSLFQRCTKCRFWVEKSEGCNHITCRCGYEFCYICGEKYQTCSHTG